LKKLVSAIKKGMFWVEGKKGDDSYWGGSDVGKEKGAPSPPSKSNVGRKRGTAWERRFFESRTQKLNLHEKGGQFLATQMEERVN